MKLTPAPVPGRAGFSTVEVFICAMLVSGMLFVAGMATDRCMDLFRQHRSVEEVSTRGNRLLQRLAVELSFGRRGSLEPLDPAGESALGYQESLGVQNGGVVWGPNCRLGWEREIGEADDDKDNDGDGIVDEGQVVWIQRPGEPDERRVIWAHGASEFWPGETFDGTDENDDGLIDERGLCFTITGDVLTVRLAMQGTGPNGNVVTKTFETSVLLRN
jgi:hypothetical protein